MPVSEAQKRASLKYKHTHWDDIKPKQAQYAKKYYLANRQKAIDRIILKREFLRLCSLADI